MSQYRPSNGRYYALKIANNQNQKVQQQTKPGVKLRVGNKSSMLAGN